MSRRRGAWNWICRLFGVPAPRITLEAHDNLMRAIDQFEAQVREHQQERRS